MRWNARARRARRVVGLHRRARRRRRPRRRGRSRSGGSRSPPRTLALVALVDGRLEPARAPRPSRRARAARRRAGRPLAALLRGRRARLGRARGADVLRGAAPDRARRAARPPRAARAPSSSARASSARSASSRSRSTAAATDGGRSAARVAAGLGSARHVRRARHPLEAAPRRSRRRPLTVAFWDCLVGAARRRAGAARSPTASSRADAGEWAAVLALGDRLHGVSTLVYATLLRHVTAQAAGVLTFLEPVAGVLLAWALLDERPGAGDARRRRPRPRGGDRRRRCSSRPRRASRTRRAG